MQAASEQKDLEVIYLVYPDSRCRDPNEATRRLRHGQVDHMCETFHRGARVRLVSLCILLSKGGQLQVSAGKLFWFNEISDDLINFSCCDHLAS